jgi:4-amino-4-deoxy-L-arabinose transferase-like glycosyltransferase
MFKPNYKPKQLLFWGAIITLAATFALQLKFLLWGQWTYDEGFYFLVVRLMDKGYMPYHELHMSEQPLMAWSAYAAHWLWNSIWGMRFLMVGYALISVAALIAIGRVLNGPLAGLLAGLLLVAHYEFFYDSRLVNPETTSTALALVAIALLLRYCTSGKRYLLILSALALAGSFLFKLFMVIALPLAALILAFYPAGLKEKKRIATDYAIWFGLMVVIVLIAWMMVGLSGLIEQSVLFYLNRNVAYAYNLPANLKTIWNLLSPWPILSLLALVGLGVAVYQFKSWGWLVLSWTLLTFLFLLTFTPLRSKHLSMLMPLVALLPALGLSQLITWWLRQTETLPKWGGAIIFILLAIALTREMATPFNRLVKPVKPLLEGSPQIVAQGLAEYTAPNDCLITDDPYLAYVSGRLPPPWLSNVSYARFESGSLTLAELQDITTQSGCQVAAPLFDRLKNGLPGYYEWLKLNYLRIWVVEGANIMLGKPLTQASPAIPAYANFNNLVELIGLDWIEDESGQRYLTLYWRGQQRADQSYKIFVHVRNEAGQTIANADHEVYGGLLPTQLWPINGGILKDTIALHSDIPPGRYTLYIGLYQPQTLERLPIINDASGENAAIAPGIVVD